MTKQQCVCGSGTPEATCCGPIVGGAPAATALALMRSRYTAFVRGNVDYLLATHDASKRRAVDRVALAAFCRDTGWLGLEIVDVVRGCATDDDGVVEFIARGVTNRRPFAQRERSRFSRVDGRWFYVDGTTTRA